MKSKKNENLLEEDTTIKKPIKKKFLNKEIKDLEILKSLNKKVSIILNPNEVDLEDNEKKKRIGIIITTLIFLVLIISSYYFLIYEPAQKELDSAKNTKINQLNSLFKGPLASSNEGFTLRNEIKNSKNIFEVESIDILGPATKSWQSYQQKSINLNKDSFNRTMAIYTANETKNVIMTGDEAQKLVKENDATILSNIKFEKPNTIVVPILISRLQASGGLVSIGSIVDIYTQNSEHRNETNETTNINQTNPDISSCTVLSIIRCKESGEIDSKYGKTHTTVEGNTTYPKEDSKTFTSDVEEMLKGAIIGGYDEKQTINLLKEYGLKLSNYEREINLGDLDAKYLLLIETPSDKVNYLLENMNQIILTIPTKNAPDWMVNEINASYKK